MHGLKNSSFLLFSISSKIYLISTFCKMTIDSYISKNMLEHENLNHFLWRAEHVHCTQYGEDVKDSQVDVG